MGKSGQTVTRHKVFFHRVRAALWLLFGILSTLMGWQNSVALVWFASVYANVVSDWGASEAADNQDVVKRLERIERLLEGIATEKGIAVTDPVNEGEAVRPERKVLYKGQCHGGPLDGREMTSRFQKGLVVVDRGAQLAWIYDYVDQNGTGQFTVREDSGRDLDDEKRWAAAEGADFDVVVP